MSIRPMTAVIVVTIVLLPPGGATAWQQNRGPISTSDPSSAPRAQATIDFWTAERMAAAVPMEAPTRLVENLPAQQNLPVVSGDPILINGWAPGSPPYVEVRTTVPRSSLTGINNPQAYGVPPTNPLSGPYGPFQRWALEGAYLVWPRSTIGKLFFQFGASTFVCSATVIGRSTIVTAGHCLSNGAGQFASNVLFCPSYFQGGVNPQRGCWAATFFVTPTAWHNSADPDYDYACGVTDVTGTVHASKIGIVTGFMGRALNFSDVTEVTMGYPAVAPFDPGNIIQTTASVDWYNVDFVAGGQVSKVIGSDLTGGSSGGGWFLSWRHPTVEILDTDANSSTDPANHQGPHINGVNSHKRCVSSCFTPPTAVAGTFWQEMTSPPFRAGAADPADSDDIFTVCLNHANNASAPASAPPAHASLLQSPAQAIASKLNR